MNTFSWSAPAHAVNAETARGAVLAQHQEIRRLLQKARAIAEAALDGAAPCPDSVASVIGDIHTAMAVHLDFEEKVLIPLFEQDLPLGPERARRMVDEHRRQRATLAELHAEATRHPNLPMLPAKLSFLASWLLADMAEEEHERLAPHALRDDQVVIDQCSG
jgi:hypothetical protein